MVVACTLGDVRKKGIIMDDVEKLLKGTVEQLDKLLNARNVLGDPIERGNATVYPIVSFGFGFGAGGGTGGKSGNTGGTGAGGGIKPIGAIIIDEDGARVEGIHGATSEIIGVVSKAASKAIDKAAEVSGRKAPPPSETA
jgi:uncharacterized spore protein YtfJ